MTHAALSSLSSDSNLGPVCLHSKVAARKQGQVPQIGGIAGTASQVHRSRFMTMRGDHTGS